MTVATGDVAFGGGYTASIVRYKEDEETAVFSVTSDSEGRTEIVSLPYDLFNTLIRRHLGWCA